MATERATLAYRPDKEERDLLEQIAKKYGASMSRAIGLCVREKAEREGLTAKAEKEPATV